MKSFFKFLSKNKLYTAINLFGLAVSLMFVILIADYSSVLLGVDHFHKNKERIFVLGNEEGFSMNHYCSLQLQERFPEIEKICGVASYELTTFITEDNPLKANILFADSTFFDIFTFQSIAGDLSTALNAPDKAVITESYALKMFGKKDAVGETIHIKGTTMEGEQTVTLPISAVIKDLERTILPLNTEIILPFQNTNKLAYNNYYSPNVMIKGGDNANKTFILVKEGADLQAKSQEIFDYMKETDLDIKLGETKEISLVPLTKMMLYPRNHGEGLEHGNRQMLMILLSAGIAILIFAITNYINLTVAQTGFRAREMACRQLLGDTKKGVTLRLIGESTIMTLAAFLLGFLLAYIFQRPASTLCGENIDLIKNLSPLVALVYILFIAFLGIATGVIPAITLSKYKPIDIVRGSLKYRSKMLFSKIFLIIQNVVTIVMLISAMTIYLQINHLISAPLGHKTQGIIEGIDFEMGPSELQALTNELRTLPCVEAVGTGKNSAIFMGMRSMQGFADKDGNDKWMTIMKLDTTAIRILGLEFTTEHRAGSKSVYINEEAATLLGVTPDDTEFSIDYGNGAEKRVLAGIFKNFRLGSVLSEYTPMVVSPMEVATISDDYARGFVVYIQTVGDLHEAYKMISECFTKVTGREVNNTLIVGEDYIAKQFRKEKNTANIILIFSIIAVIISALGLYAMSTYFTRQRIKEIGIRKIFGGTRKEILRRQLWSFVLPLIISIVIAIPVSWIIMSRWLQNYSYRIPIYPWIYIAAGAFIIIIGLLTVLGQSLKAVNSNPIKAIRTE